MSCAITVNMNECSSAYSLLNLFEFNLPVIRIIFFLGSALQPWRWWQDSPLKRWYRVTTWQGTTIQKISKIILEFLIMLYMQHMNTSATLCPLTGNRKQDVM